MIEIKDLFFDKSLFLEIKNLAFESWNFTYGDFLSEKEIFGYINSWYSEESLSDFYNKIQNNTAKGFLLFENGILIGFIFASISENKLGEINKLYLKPNKLGNGFGKILIKKVDDFFRKNKISKVCLFVDKRNLIGIKFYTKNNFKFDHKKDTLEEYYMEKELRVL